MRMAKLRGALLLAAASSCASCASSVASRARGQPSGARLVAFVHASVVPMDEERVLRDHGRFSAGSLTRGRSLDAVR